MPSQNFAPIETKSLTPTTSGSDRITWGSAVTGIGDGVNDCLISNLSGGTVFVEFGDSSVTAADTDFPVPHGASFIINKGEALNAAVKLESGVATGKVYLTAGIGK